MASTPLDYAERFNPARRREGRSAPVEQLPDPVGAEIERMREEEMRVQFDALPSPEKAARVTRLARETETLPAEIEHDPDGVEDALRTRRMVDLARTYPAIGKFALANPRGAAVARDDAENLGLLGNAWDGIKSASSAYDRLKRAATGQLVAGAYWASSMGWDFLATADEALSTVLYPLDAATATIAGAVGVGYDPDKAFERRQARFRDYAERTDMERQRKAVESAFGNYWVDMTLSGLQSAPAMVAAAATRNPSAAAALLGGGTAAQGYQQALRSGASKGAAIRYGTTTGFFEGALEKLPISKLGEAIVRRTPWGKAFVEQMVVEIPAEQVTTILQDLSAYAYLPENADKTFGDYLRERPGAALDTALATSGGVAATTGSIRAAQRASEAASHVSRRLGEVRQARAERAFFDKAGKAAEASKLRERDPEAFRELLRQQAEDSGATNVFIPGEAVREFKQSDSYDADSDPFDQRQFEEAMATGGDIVMPIEDVLTDLVGTPAWEAVRDDMRLDGGGMSAREATTFEESMANLVAEASAGIAESEKADRAARTTREKLVDRVAEMFGVSFTSPVARDIAELVAQRMQTRAERLGQDLTTEPGFEVRQVMPEGVRAAVQADQLDLVLNAMRKGADPVIGEGPSLLEFIKARGGINDPGGDLRSMGVEPSILRDTNPDQGAFGGLSGAGDYGIDNTLRAAVDAGYFPELAKVENEAGPSSLETQALIDAIGRELAGDPVYASTREDPVRAAAEDLRAMLNESGYDPEAMSDAEIRDLLDSMDAAGAEGRAFEQPEPLVDAIDSRVAIQAYEQSAYNEQARGRIVFDQNRRIIELFQSRNLSTPLHELSHMWLEELFADAAMPDAPEQLKADAEAVKSYFASNGHAVGDDGMIPTEAHELWARSGERYFMEGKAPTPALTRLFEAFRMWLVNIYRTVARLDAPITPEIREVFDRLLATDEEIAAARERQSLDALFKEAAGLMTEAEFAAYRSSVEGARAEASAKLLDKSMRTIRRKTQERYREARKAIKAEETERIDGSPLFKALSLMREQRIDKRWIEDEFGVDALDMLPRRVPPIYADGGIDAQTVAERAGYPSARDMIEALIGAETAQRQAKEGGDQRPLRARAIETATEEEFKRRYGDPFNDGSIEREALAAVNSEKQGEVFASEIRVLGRKSGKRPTPWRIARDWARGKIRSGTVALEASGSAIQRYARNAAKAGREAERAMLAQNFDEAFRQKQFQMMNSALLAEAKAAADEVDAAVRRMDKVARAKTRKSVDQDYLEQAQALLETVDLRKRSQVGIDRQGKWEEWAAAREAEGFDIVVPQGFEATIGKTNWTRLTVENLLALDEAVKQVMHLGRLKQTLLDRQEERKWDELYREAETNADNLGRKPPKGSFTDPTWWDSIKSRAATVDAALLKMEQVFDWLDEGDSNGVFNRTVFRPISEAQAREQDMTRDYFGRIREVLRKVPPKTVRRWADKVTLDLIDPETGLPAVFERKKIVALALNWGNAGNRQRLADGYGWSQQGIERALMKNLSEEEWTFVQDIWDVIDTLWPEIEKMERAVNGVAPDKVEATEVVTPFGTLRGGYYPAIYDTTLDYTAEEQTGRKADLFEANYIRATTRASATKERAEKASRPVLLDVGVINRHLGEVIHDITHREAVVRAHRFLTNRRVMRAVDETLGPEVRKQFRPWLNHIANAWAAERAGNEGLGKFLTKARANTTVVGMGWRFTTMLTQIAGYSNSFEAVGAKWVSAAIAQTGAHPVETFDFVMEHSDEMRNRLDTLDRDIRLAIRQMAGKESPLTAAKRFAFHGIGYMDRVVSVPTWVGAYNKAIAAGMSERDAAYAGDKAVRLSQGAGGAKDLAAVATGQGRYGEAFKLMTMFYSYLSSVYSRQRNFMRDAKGASLGDVPGLIARAWWLVVVPPLLAEILSGRGPDDDEDAAWWAFKEMVKQALGAIPGVRDVADPVLSGLTGDYAFGYRLSPVQNVGESLERVAKDAGKVAKGKETTRMTRNVLEATGYFTGLVPGQAAAAAQFWVDVASGDADPDTIGDWYTGVTKGRIAED